MNPLLTPELRELVHEKNSQELAGFLSKLRPSQSAELIDGLPLDEIGWILDVLPDDLEAQVFAYLFDDQQQALVAGAGRPVIALAILAFVLLAISRRYHGPVRTAGAAA